MKVEAIKTYLDNVFAAYPKTDTILSLKQDMLANMEEKYSALRQSGKSEHEAAYSVITNFGNIEEITSELGLKDKNKDKNKDGAVHLSWEEAYEYLMESRKSGIITGLGVWIIMAGVSAVVSIDNLFIMFAAIAIAVVMFIKNGGRMEAYESYEDTRFHLDSNTRQRLEMERDRFKTRSTTMIAVGVAVILLAVGSLVTFDFSLGLFLNVIGFSVFLFINSSFGEAYDVLLT